MVVGKTFPLQFVLSAVDNLSGPLGKVRGRLGAIGKTASRIGRSLTLGATLPILGLATATISTAAKFEKSMNSVAAITEASGEDFNALRDRAKELGISTVFTASEVADAMTKLAIAGFGTTEILDAIAPALDLAAASGNDLAASTEILAGTLRASRLETSESARVADALTNAFTSSGVELEDLAEAIKISTPVFAGMNIPLEENLALVGALGNAMIRGSLSGTALKNALVNLTIVSGKAGPALNRLNLRPEQIADSEGNVKSLIDTVKLLGDAGATTTDLFLIFGKRAGPAMSVLVGEGAEAIEKLEAKIGRSGSAARVAAVQMQGASGAMARMKAASEGLMIAIGDSGLLQAFSEIVTKLAGWVQHLAETNPKMLKLATTVALVVAAVGPAVFIFGKLTLILGGLTTAIGFVGTALTFLAANPVGATIVAIAALVLIGSHIIENWDAVKESAGKTWSFVKDVVGGALSWVWTQIKKLTRLILPTWLENLLGLGGEEGENVAASLVAGGGLPSGPGGASVIGAADPIARAENLAAGEKEVRVKIEGQLTRVSVEADAGVEADVDLGLAMVGGA